MHPVLKSPRPARCPGTGADTAPEPEPAERLRALRSLHRVRPITALLIAAKRAWPRLAQAASFPCSLARILHGRPQVSGRLAGHELLRIILARRSVRSFASQDLPEDVFAAILEAGRLAPSTVNLQTWTFLTFTPASWQATFGQALPFGGQRARARPRRHPPRQGRHRRLSRQPAGGIHRGGDERFTGRHEHEHRGRSIGRLIGDALGDGAHRLLRHRGSGEGPLPPTWGLAADDDLFSAMLAAPGRPCRPGCPRIRCPTPGPIASRTRVMQGWLGQMVAGYKAMNPRSSFDAQLRTYQRKIGQAEAELEGLVLGKAGEGAGEQGVGSRE